MKWETKTSENMKIRRKRLSKTKTMNEGNTRMPSRNVDKNKQETGA